MLPIASLLLAVEVAPTPPTQKAMQLLVEACSSGLRNASCHDAKSLPGQAAAVALVTLRGDTDVLVEVGAKGQQQWLQREVHFSPYDPLEERWRSIGFSVALLAERALPAATGWDTQPSEHDLYPAAHHHWALAPRATVASAFVGGAGRVGAELRLVSGTPRGWFYSGALDAAWASDRGVDARWLGGSAGGGFRVGVGAELSVGLRLEVQVEQIRMDVAQGLTAQAAWVPGISLGTDWDWAVAEHWALTAGGELFVSDGPSRIRLDGQELGTIGAVGFLVALGVVLVP